MTNAEKSLGLLDKIPHRGPEWHEELPHDSYYYTGFWGSYKGYVKGMVGGMIIGALLGGAIGLGAAAAAAIVGSTAAFGAIAFGAIAGSFALAFGLLGTIKGIHEFTMIGANAGVGVALDELEVRINRSIEAKSKNTTRVIATLIGKEKDLPAISAAIDAEADTVRPAKAYSESPHVDSATAKSTSLFHGKVGVIGLLLGVAAGALICFAAPAAVAAVGSGGLFAGLAAAAGHAAVLAELAHVSAAGVAAVMTACGLFGASFGLDRILFRRVFDFTDKLFEGRVLPQNLVAKSHSHQISRTQELASIPSIPAPPNQTLYVKKDIHAHEPGPRKQKEWAERIKAEQVLKSFDHTQAPMH